MAPVCSRPVIAAGGPPRRQPYRGGPFWRYPIARMTEGIPGGDVEGHVEGHVRRLEASRRAGSTPTIGSSVPIHRTEQPLLTIGRATSAGVCLFDNGSPPQDH